MVLMAGYDLPIRAIRQQVASAIEMIVHLERMDDGTRRVTTITEVQRMEGDVIMLQDLFTFRLEAVTGDRKVVGDLRSCGLRPSFERKFAKHGIELPAELFGPQLLSEAMSR
jgi:pilus assembly protein CpaF